MRSQSPTRKLMFAAASLLLLVPLGAAALLAQDVEDEEAELKRIAAEELEKAVAKGKELWKSKQFGKKSCTECHDNPDKPKLEMGTREFAYPAYSRRAKTVVTLQQKINEMIKFQCRGKVLEADSTDLAALAAYVVHQRDANK